jgi:Rieske Fe-S protein
MDTTRRTVITGAGAAALAAALPGCTTYDEGSGGQSSAPASEPPPGQALAKTADIPVGGGKVFEQAKVVVTQPEAGQFKCFTAVCTHQGCLVTGIEGGTINCDCHGSKFKVEDGSVANGPAGSALAARQITVSGDAIQLT